MIKRIGLFAVVALLAAQSFAQAPACPSGTLANVLGTSCTIGNVTFIFQNNFQGSIDTEPGSGPFVITPLDPGSIAFTPVTSGNQVGFTLFTNFVDITGANGLSFSSHSASFSYSTQVNGAFEIVSEGLSAVANQSSNLGFVLVEEQQCYPNEPCTFIAIGNPPAGPTATLAFPSLGSQPDASFSFTDLASGAQAGQQASLTSATFLYTVVPQIPPPPPANLHYKNIDLPGEAATFVTGINDEGEIVGSFQDSAGVVHGYVTDHDGDSPSTVDFPNATSTSINGINDRKDFVGSYVDNGGVTHGFAFQDGSFSTIDFPGAIFNFAEGINNRGQIVGVYQNADFSVHGYLLDNGVFTTFDDPSGIDTQLISINDRGDSVGTFLDNNFLQQSFLLFHGAFQPIAVPAGVGGTIAVGLNNREDVVGFFQDITIASHGFLQSHAGLSSIDFPNATGTEPSQINSDGTIVGIYTDDTGAFHSFLAKRQDQMGGDNDAGIQSSSASITLQSGPGNNATALKPGAPTQACASSRQILHQNPASRVLTCNSSN